MIFLKILFLGPDDSPLAVWLKDQGENIVTCSAKLTVDFISDNGFNFLVSYGYRHIIKQEILDFFGGRAINLHISLLPWNRGADPNLWSFIDNTPKGVTIHYLDAGVDTGDIIIQKEVFFDSDSETLKSSYEKLQKEIQLLFKNNWSHIKSGICPRIRQIGLGSRHFLKDKEPLLPILEQDGWDTRVSVLEDLYQAKKE